MTKNATRFFGVLVSLILFATVCSAAPVRPDAAGGGGHDFDFLLGTWRTHISDLQTTSSGKSKWVHFTGTVVNTTLWDGSGDIEQIDASNGSSKFQGMTVRLYDARNRQWNVYWADSSDGVLQQPTPGTFANGAGDFYDQETMNGRAVFVHQRYFGATPNSYRFEEWISRDNGRTWSPDFTAYLTRISHSESTVAGPPVAALPAAQHDFDWQFGAWKITMSRLLHPLSGSTAREQLLGTVAVHKIWNGGGNYALIYASGKSDSVHIFALRLYVPQARQWSLSFTTRGDGALSVPMYGTFKNGRGEFYDQEFFHGRAILDRFIFSNIRSGSAHDEEAFSDDGGKTWETTWINTHQRITQASTGAAPGRKVRTLR